MDERRMGEFLWEESERKEGGRRIRERWVRGE